MKLAMDLKFSLFFTGVGSFKLQRKQILIEVYCYLATQIVLFLFGQVLRCPQDLKNYVLKTSTAISLSKYIVPRPRCEQFSLGLLFRLKVVQMKTVQCLINIKRDIVSEERCCC